MAGCWRAPAPIPATFRPSTRRRSSSTAVVGAGAGGDRGRGPACPGPSAPPGPDPGSSARTQLVTTRTGHRGRQAAAARTLAPGATEVSRRTGPPRGGAGGGDADGRQTDPTSSATRPRRPPQRTVGPPPSVQDDGGRVSCASRRPAPPAGTVAVRLPPVCSAPSPHPARTLTVPFRRGEACDDAPTPSTSPDPDRRRRPTRPRCSTPVTASTPPSTGTASSTAKPRRERPWCPALVEHRERREAAIAMLTSRSVKEPLRRRRLSHALRVTSPDDAPSSLSGWRPTARWPGAKVIEQAHRGRPARRW